MTYAAGQKAWTDRSMNPSHAMPVVDDELNLLRSLVPLHDMDIVELGRGKAELARRLVATCAGCTVAAIEIDQRQHARNLEHPAPPISICQWGGRYKL